MIGKAISQDRMVNRTGQAVESSFQSGPIVCSDQFLSPCSMASRWAATSSQRRRWKHRACSILSAALFAMIGAAPELGSSESAWPLLLREDPARSSEVGLASWYGYPYHGRKAANGETYDMNRLTAAHRSLPFGTRVVIHNLRNARMVEVRITDRGPFVEGRLIDLSRAAANFLGFQRAGLERVRIEVLSRSSTSGSVE